MVEVDWRFTNEVIAEIKVPLDEVCRKGAEMIARDARALAPQDTGTLKSQIDIKKSPFRGGGWMVEAQGSKNYDRYYASFVEFGTPKRNKNYPVQRYMRPAIKRNRPKIQDMWQRALDE